MSKIRIKTGDTVIVLSGREKGKTGKVLKVDPTKNTVIVEGVNMVKCHTKPRKQGETGGIIEKEAALRVCKVQYFCESCKKGSRLGYKFVDGKKVRICKCNNEEV